MPFRFSAFNTSDPAVPSAAVAVSTDKSIAIQIEVDIEPPAETDGLDDGQLARLGLPTHHVHYQAGSKLLGAADTTDSPLGRTERPSRQGHYRAGQPAGSELLAPEDIQVSYTEEGDEENGPEEDFVHRRMDGRRAHLKRPTVQRHSSSNLRPSGFNKASSLSSSDDDGGSSSEDDSLRMEVFDPPRALPALEDGFATAAATEEALTERPEVDANDETTRSEGLDAVATEEAMLDTTNEDDSEFSDGIYGVPAFCSLDCGPAGTCHMGRDEGAGGGWSARCLCPAGREGAGCALSRGHQVPQLTGLSHLALPTLQNAYSDLHLSLDFRPTAWTGGFLSPIHLTGNCYIGSLFPTALFQLLFCC
jgi:hypothetical protein